MKSLTPISWHFGAHSLRRILPQSGWVVFALAVGFMVAWPILKLQFHAFVDGGSAFARMIALPRFGSTLSTTVLLALASSILALLIGGVVAWCATLLPARFRRVGQIIPLLPLVLPGIAAVTGWIIMLSPEVGVVNIMLRALPFFSDLQRGPFDIYTLPWIIILTALSLSSFVYLFVQTGLQNMGQELEAAAAAAGASPTRTLFTITIPLLRPSILFATTIVFLLGLGQFTVPLLLGRASQINVLTTEMFYLTLEAPVDFGLGAALGTPILVAGLVMVVLQKYMLGEQRRFVVVSARSRHQARETRWWSVPVILLYAFVTTVLPILALIYLSFKPFWSGELSFDDFTLRHYKSVLSNTLLVRSITTSMVVSFVAVLALIPIGFACAFAMLQSSGVARITKLAIDFFVTLPLAIPASLMGFGILLAYSSPPFLLYGTVTIIAVTYVTLMVNYATRLQSATLIATGEEFREASRACGAGPIRSLLYVMLPMARRGMAAAAALTFVILSHEFSASMMVRSIRTQVMGSMMYEIWSSGGVYPQGAVFALIMVVVTLAGVLMATMIAGLDSLKKL